MLASHFQNVCNINVLIDWSVLDEFKQKPIHKRTDDKLNVNEFNCTINKLTFHKGEGINAIKAFDKDNRMKLFEICYDFFENKSDIHEWKFGV